MENKKKPDPSVIHPIAGYDKEIYVKPTIIVNIIALILYGIDKDRARKGAWLISEKTLLGIAITGGSLGATLGMNFFHHKTKHWYFRYGLPAI